jgi:hypothetical protein
MPFVDSVEFNVKNGVYLNLKSPNAIFFNAKYDALRRSGDYFEQITLCAIFDVIMGCMKSIDEALITRKGNVLRFKSMFEENKSVWLLYKEYLVDKTKFSDQLANFIISKHDVKSGPANYALLYTISRADKDIIADLENMPMSMLHDMYETVIEAEINEQFRNVIRAKI